MKEIFKQVIITKLRHYWWLVILVMIGLGVLLFYVHLNHQTALQQNEILLKQTNTSAKHATTYHKIKAPNKKNNTNEIYVEIKGAVNKPGIYHLTSQQRLFDALSKAGGLKPEADTRKLNLAQQLHDQDSFYVPKQGEMLQTDDLVIAATYPDDHDDSGDHQDNSNHGDQVNLNTATVTDLQKLTGIGPKKAAKIIEYREQSGKFKSVDDLKQVAGIGDKNLATLKPHLCV